MRIITGDRGSGKTEAMLNWFCDPFNGFAHRLIVVPNQQEKEYVLRRFRNFASQVRLPADVVQRAHSRVVVWGNDAPMRLQGMEIREVWIDNLDTIIAQVLRLHLNTDKVTGSMTDPAHIEHMVSGWSTLKEVK